MPHGSARKTSARPAVDSAKRPAVARRVRICLLLLLIFSAFGVGGRIVAVLLAPQNSYLPDHLSNMGWSDYAFEHGPWRIYELPALQPLVAHQTDRRTGRAEEVVKLNAHACNYPPLSAYVFWVQGAVWHALDHRLVTVQPAPWLARRFGITQPVTSRVVDTRASRFANALPGIICDFLLAWAVAALVGVLSPSRSPIREAIAFGVTLLAPPILLDSAFWTQADSWVTCLLVWCLVYLMRERLAVAGLLYGAALMTKPQAILFAPVLAYVFFALRLMPGGSWRRALRMWQAFAAAAAVVVVVAVPFMINDARSETNREGVFRWAKRSYVGTIGDPRYERTTLNAFNIWWLDLLAEGSPPRDPAKQAAFFEKAWSTEQAVLGVRKSMWGKALLALAVVLAGGLCARKWKWQADSWPACAYLVALAAFALPTGVHERYIYYCIPFLIALAVRAPVWIVPLLALLLVGTFEMISFRWVTPPQLYAPDGVVRGLSAFLAVLTVFSLLYSYATVVPRAGRAAGRA